MIVFLAVCYCGVLALLVKFGVIRLNLWWKLSPVLWVMLLFLVLFVPMQWGAPAGTVNVYRDVIEITPDVSGTVTEVPVEGLAAVAEGDVLFRIDATPYQLRVDQARAQLADAEQTAKELAAAAEAADATTRKTEADVDLLKAEQAEATAAVGVANAAVNESNAILEKARDNTRNVDVEFEIAKGNLARTQAQFDEKLITKSVLDNEQSSFAKASNQRDAANADVKVATESVERARQELTAAKTRVDALAVRMTQLVDAELPRVRAVAREAKLKAESRIGDEHTLVATARAALASAEYDLSRTEVHAPSDGYAVGVTLRPGQRVGTAGRSWMSYVPERPPMVGVGIPQYALRYVRPGQRAEVTFKVFPGRIFGAEVDAVVRVAPEGQVQPSGTVLSAPDKSTTAIPYGVRLKLDPVEDVDLHDLPSGATGTAAIYTDRVRATHVIRKVMLRMQAWTNYVAP